jgi:hypothetical protein
VAQGVAPEFKPQYQNKTLSEMCPVLYIKSDVQHILFWETLPYPFLEEKNLYVS